MEIFCLLAPRMLSSSTSHGDRCHCCPPGCMLLWVEAGWGLSRSEGKPVPWAGHRSFSLPSAGGTKAEHSCYSDGDGFTFGLAQMKFLRLLVKYAPEQLIFKQCFHPLPSFQVRSCQRSVRPLL